MLFTSLAAVRIVKNCVRGQSFSPYGPPQPANNILYIFETETRPSFGGLTFGQYCSTELVIAIDLCGIIGYHSNSITCNTPLILALMLVAYSSKSNLVTPFVGDKKVKFFFVLAEL